MSTVQSLRREAALAEQAREHARVAAQEAHSLLLAAERVLYLTELTFTQKLARYETARAQDKVASEVIDEVLAQEHQP